MKKIIKYLMLTLFFVPLNCLAATGVIDIYSSSKSLTIGNTFTITVYCKSSSTIGTCEYTLSYDSSKVKFVSASDTTNCNGAYCVYYAGNKSSSKKFTFKAIANGTTTISAKAYGMIDFDEKEMKTTVSPVTVTISKVTPTKPIVYSTNNYLSSLSVSDYELDKAFDKNTTSYTVSVPSEVEKITINATKEDSKAKITGTGKFNVSEGDNSFKIVVTSEKGTTKTYTVNVVVEDKNPIVVNIDNEEYTVVKRKSSLERPENYEDITVNINNVEIPAFVSDITNYILIGLKNKEGVIKLYIYDSNLNTYTLFNELSFSNLKINLIENNDVIIPDLTKEEININDVIVSAYKLNENYYLIYGKNSTTGNDNWYLYESLENTIQIFDQKYFEEQNLKLDNANKLILIFSGSTFILAIFLIISLLTRGKKSIKNKKNKNKISKDFLNDDDIKNIKAEKKSNNKEKNDAKEDIIVLDDKEKDKNISKAKTSSHDEFKGL